MKASVIINAASGSCNESDETVLRDILAKHAVEVVSFHCGGGGSLAEAFSAIQKAKPECLVVLGGDGTIQGAIESCQASVDYFILLPGGTMNLLSKAIYGDRSWKDILEDTLTNPRPHDVSSGRVGDKTFYVAAVLGTPSLFAHTREAVRGGDVGSAVAHSASVLGTPLMTFRYESSTEQGNAETLLVTTPLVSDELHNEARALDVAAVSIPGAFETLRLLSAAALGIWRSDESVSTHAARKLSVTATESIPATLDGEPIDLPKSVEIEFVPAAFRALVPGK